jgi:hypothetical protein
MSQEHALDRSPPPKGPNWQCWIAVALEAAIVMSFVVALPSRSNVVGLILCVLYSHFSATRAALFNLFAGDP